MRCPLCNEEVIFERNLKKHQKGKVCKGFVFEKKMRADGWSPIHSRYCPWLNALKIQYVRGPCMYEGFGNQRYVKVRYFAWVQNRFAEIIALREGVPTFVGPIQTPDNTISRVKEMLREERDRWICEHVGREIR